MNNVGGYFVAEGKDNWCIHCKLFEYVIYALLVFNKILFLINFAYYVILIAHGFEWTIQMTASI